VPDDGTALVLLVDERSAGPERPSVVARVVAAPLVERPPIDRTADKATRLAQLCAAGSAEDAEWRRALRADPDVRAFLDAPVAPRAD